MKLKAAYSIEHEVALRSDFFDHIETIVSMSDPGPPQIRKLLKLSSQRFWQDSMYFVLGMNSTQRRGRFHMEKAVRLALKLQAEVSASKKPLGNKAAALLQNVDIPRDKIVYVLLAWAAADHDIVIAWRDLNSTARDLKRRGRQHRDLPTAIRRWLVTATILGNQEYRPATMLLQPSNRIPPQIHKALGHARLIERRLIEDLTDLTFPDKRTAEAAHSKKPKKLWFSWAVTSLREVLMSSGFTQAEANKAITQLFSLLVVRVNVPDVIRKYRSMKSSHVVLDPKITWNLIQVANQFLSPFQTVAPRPRN